MNGYILREVLGEETGIARQMHDDAATSLNHVSWVSRLQTMHLLSGDYAGRRGGLVSALESHATSEAPQDDIALINSLNRTFGQNTSFVPGPPPTGKRDKQVAQFGVRHYLGSVMYAVDGFCQRNMDLEVSPDFYSLFRDASHSKFVRRLFGVSQIALDYHPEEESTIVGTFLSTRPATRPTVRKPQANARSHPHAAQALAAPSELAPLDDADPANTYIGEVSSALEDIFAAADFCKLWNIIHIRPDNPTNANSLPGVPDKAFIRQQVQATGLVDLSQRRAPNEYTVSLGFEAFIERYAAVVKLSDPHTEHEMAASVLVDQVAEGLGWIRGQHYTTGHRMVFMTERVWRSIEMELRIYEKQRQQRRRQTGTTGILDALAQVDHNGDLIQPPQFGFEDNASTVFGSELGTADGFNPDVDDLFSDADYADEEDEDYGDEADDYDDGVSVASRA
ncbi:hypothetical protein FBU31_007140, partial [Coemansia sp. 'formosensis']